MGDRISCFLPGFNICDFSYPLSSPTTPLPWFWREPGETAPGADLGGSSKYSNKNFEDRSGERFYANRSGHGLVDPKR